MTPEEQKSNKKTSPRKINWSKIGQVATDVSIVAATAFLSGLAMAAGQQMVTSFKQGRDLSDRKVLSIVKDRTAV